MKGTARKTAVVIMRSEQFPPLTCLRPDIRFAGFALRIEAVEGLVETLLGRLAGVNRTAGCAPSFGGLTQAKKA